MKPAHKDGKGRGGPGPRSPARTGWLAAAALGLLATAAAIGSLAAAGRAGPPEDMESPHGDFQGDCGICHPAAKWTPVKPTREFEHGRGDFPLDNAHAALPCADCHSTLDFTKQSRKLCSSCHFDAHRGEFGADCSRCHTPRSFQDRGRMAREHAGSRFPLLGAHAGLDCESCHRPVAPGRIRFVGQSGECRSCHYGDYRSAAEPDHVASRLSLDCADCHTPLAWVPARFNHDAQYFPINSGTHAGIWVTCRNCHVTGNLATFTCFSCHFREETADRHDGVPGYVYESGGCYWCHPRGVAP